MNENLENAHQEIDNSNSENNLEGQFPKIQNESDSEIDGDRNNNFKNNSNSIESLLLDVENLQKNLAQCDAERKILETKKNKLLTDISVIKIQETEYNKTIKSLQLNLLELNKKLQDANKKYNDLELKLNSEIETSKVQSEKNTILESSIKLLKANLKSQESKLIISQNQKIASENQIKEQSEQISNLELQIEKLKKSNFRKPIYAIIFTFILTVFSVLLAIILFGTTERYALNKCGQKKKIPSHIPVAQVKKSIVKPSIPPFEHTIEFGENGDAQLITPSPSKSSEYASSGSDSDQLNEESEENPNANSVDDSEDSTPKVASPIVIEEKNLLNLINNLSSNLIPDAESKILQLASRSTIPVVLNTDTGSQPMILKTFIANCKSGKYSKFDEINITPNQDGTKIQKIEIR